jgi:enoyl-[acyl-carrier protein] reductase/trans-2-enoyl-CoA reductase (NAD+)
MVITQKILRNVSLTAHPAGCRRAVEDQVAWVKAHADTSASSAYPPTGGLSMPKRVLVLGGSTGYGLSSRIVAAFGGGADTISVSFEREPSETKTATAGWYNAKAFDACAQREGLKAFSLFADAFLDETKERVADLIEEEFGHVDLIVYSLASPLRIDRESGVTYRSVLKPIGEPFTALTVGLESDIVGEATIEPAEGDQAEETVKVMGGEDWILWIEYLKARGLLANGCKTVAYSYIGPELTYPVYREGTIGKAKEHLEASAKTLDDMLAPIGGRAFVSVNKALVTRASAVIPIVPLYMALLYRVMKEQGIHEQCTEQIYRLFTTILYSGKEIPTDSEGRLRIDDWEMRSDIQREVERRWRLQRAGEPIKEGDLEGVRSEYDQIHGFGFPDIDYTMDVDPREV